MNEKKPEERSGDSPALKTYKRMVSLLYLLLRDHVRIGDINNIFKQVLVEEEVRFCDDILKAKAESLADVLGTGKYEVAEIDALWNIRGRAPSGLGRIPDIGALVELMDKHVAVTSPGPGGPLMPPSYDLAGKVRVADEGEEG